MLLQSTYYVFEMFTRRREGISLRPQLTGPAYDSPTNGPVAYIDASAVLSGDLLTGPEPKAANSFAQPEVIKTRPFADANVVHGEAALTCPRCPSQRQPGSLVRERSEIDFDFARSE